MLVCLTLNEWFTIIFYLTFCLHPGHRKGLEGKAYPAKNLPFHGESDGANVVLVEDCL